MFDTKTYSEEMELKKSEWNNLGINIDDNQSYFYLNTWRITRGSLVATTN